MKIIYTLLLPLCLLIPSTSSAKDLDTYGAECKEIGFKPKTPAYGDCVLELRRRDKSNSNSQPEPIKQNVVQAPIQQAPRGDGSADDASCQRYGFTPQTDAYGQCRMQLDNAKRQLQTLQAQNTEQQRIYDQQQAQFQKEKNRQQGLALLRYSAALAQGTSPYFSDNVANANAQVFGTAPVAPRPLPETYTITLPNSRTMTCTSINNVMNCF